MKKSYVNIADEGKDYQFKPIKEQKKTSYHYQVDMPLIHLVESLKDLERTVYPDIIENRLKNFINDLETIIYPKFPHKQDMVRAKFYCFEDFEEFIPPKEREYF